MSKRIAGFLGVLASIAGILGLLVALNIIHPFSLNLPTPTPSIRGSTPTPSTPVTQSTPPCMKSLVNFTPAPVTFIPMRLQGNNRDFDDYGVNVHLMVLPKTISGSSLGVEVYMRATTGTYGNPPTTVDGSQTYTLYSAPPGMTIASVGGDASNVDYSYIHRAGGQEDDIFISAGWVREAVFSGFWPPGSPSAGTTAQVEVVFKGLSIQLVQTQGCV